MKFYIVFVTLLIGVWDSQDINNCNSENATLNLVYKPTDC
jgi:hypothetical protein